MYNSVVHFMDDRHCARHEGSHGLKQNSWKIPGVPFDPKHGHLYYGKSGLKKICVQNQDRLSEENKDFLLQPAAGTGPLTGFR